MVIFNSYVNLPLLTIFFAQDSPSKPSIFPCRHATVPPCRAVPCRAPGPSAAAAESHGAALAGVQVHRGHRLVTVALAARAAAGNATWVEGVGRGARWVIFLGNIIPNIW
jgi:hypothetical protein